MKLARYNIILHIILFISLAGNIYSADDKIELLWPNGAPGAKGNSDIDCPTLTVFMPEKQAAPLSAIIVCPGGGYGGLATGHEGYAVGKYLNSIGVACFMLKYRLPAKGYKHPIPLQDAQRAIRLVRTRAKDWNIDPSRIGIMGFSAGGHLASTAGTHFDKGNENSTDPIDRASCRPDFMILVYPVITFKEFTHRGSMNNLIGPNPDPSLVENLSNETRVTPETPPTFLLHTDEDKAVLSENSINFYLALRKAKVPAEMHIYEKGDHGFGIGKSATVAGKTWQDRLGDWLRSRGLTIQP